MCQIPFIVATVILEGIKSPAVMEPLRFPEVVRNCFHCDTVWGHSLWLTLCPNTNFTNIQLKIMLADYFSRVKIWEQNCGGKCESKQGLVSTSTCAYVKRCHWHTGIGVTRGKAPNTFTHTHTYTGVHCRRWWRWRRGKELEAKSTLGAQ